MVHHADIEGVASEIHAETGIEAPVDAFVLADLLGFVTVPWSRGYGQVSGDRIRYPAKVRTVRQHRVVCHELAHVLLRRAGLDDADEGAADRLALALMLPRTAFVRDLGATDWHLYRMMELHPNCSAQAIAVRMCHVSPCAASIYDQGRRTALYLGDGAYEDASDDEAADRALELEAPVCGDLVSAWPLFDGRYRRVVVLRRAA